MPAAAKPTWLILKLHGEVRASLSRMPQQKPLLIGPQDHPWINFWNSKEPNELIGYSLPTSCIPDVGQWDLNQIICTDRGKERIPKHLKECLDIGWPTTPLLNEDGCMQRGKWSQHQGKRETGDPGHTERDRERPRDGGKRGETEGRRERHLRSSLSQFQTHPQKPHMELPLCP